MEMRQVLTIFASRLREARKKCGLSRAQLADRMGISHQAISYYEADDASIRRSPTLTSVVAAAQALGVSIDWLCGLKDYDTGTSFTNYRDIVELIDNLNNFAGWPGLSVSQNGLVTLELTDSTIAKFFSDEQKMSALVYSGTIDQSMYNTWLEGRKKELSQVGITSKNKVMSSDNDETEEDVNAEKE